jgi:uncharacterized protein (TIGR02246 family)
VSRTPQEIFQHHVEALGAEDLDGIVSDYADDALFITPDGVRRGKAGVREGFEKLIDTFVFADGQIRVQTVRYTATPKA